MTWSVQHFIRQCIVCQSSKYDNNPYPRLLQPSQIPNEVWMDVSMDVIEGLVKSFGKEVIFVVVDRFSKYTHFPALGHPFFAMEVA